MSEIEINVTNPKLRKTLERFKQRILENEIYEAHQTLRTIANRNVRTKSYNDAIDLLYHAAQILLKSSQPATGSDLTSYLIEIYNDASIKVSIESKSKLIQLISLFNSKEPTLKQVGIEAINWSIKFGDYKFGEPDLHHILGLKFLENNELVYEAERNLILGTNESFKPYVDLLWDWYLEDSNSNNISLYIQRIVLNYLSVENFKNAKEGLSILLQKFINKENSSINYEIIKQSNEDVFIFQDLKLLNFLQLLLFTIQSKDLQNYNRLIAHYNEDIQPINDNLQLIGEIYFGIKVQKQQSIFDMMGSLLK
ncbi:hypothetical protein WICMUC_001804 [Wickerhamomyces mucosus]|uniref:Golgi to ER traffic protein 4 n=1 Tax=Wickerhamomyces mucosus TaxID=1378264 RepID=A0A9P8TF30_9ASCO|nr:hypothetical protein WICMUC_001804 [Wickerhamomyces mucosus]